MTKIKPGDLVVCVDDSISAGSRQPMLLRRLKTYEVDRIKKPWGPYVNHSITVTDFPLFSWATKRFRPVRDDAIDIFREMAADQHQEVST